MSYSCYAWQFRHERIPQLEPPQRHQLAVLDDPEPLKETGICRGSEELKAVSL
jgi:hypothetical protein